MELPSVGPITGPSFSGTWGLGCHVSEGRPREALVPALASQRVGCIICGAKGLVALMLTEGGEGVAALLAALRLVNVAARPRIIPPAVH